MADPKQETFDILSTDATATSTSIDMRGYVIGGFYVPELAPTSGYLYFEHSADNVTFSPLWYNGSRLKLILPVTPADAEIQVEPSQFTVLRYLRVLVVTTAGVAVQQVADVSIKPRCRDYR